jgi:ATP-dependent Clp protease ATP-binding subunit ClpA
MFSERDSFAVYFLEKNNVTRLDLVSYISHKKSKSLNETKNNNNTDEDQNDQKKVENNILEKYCINLNKKALDGKIDPLIGRNLEIERTTQI